MGSEPFEQALPEMMTQTVASAVIRQSKFSYYNSPE
jgi:hypothetical protein